MIELQRNFLSGVMNKDLDPHFLPDGTYREAYNIIVGDSDGAFVEEDGSRNGVAQNYLGNILKGTDLELANATCIGSLAYETNNSIYWLVASDTLDAIYEYNETTDTTTPVLQATKATPTTPSLLGFDKAFFVTGINYINGLLFWTDNLNPPRRINIDRCKNYAIDGFTEADINVILAPPLKSPSIVLSTTGDSNNLENKFLYFAYRYKYTDNEYSALSPFSPVAFLPKHYYYDYGVSENTSMQNNYNTVTISYDRGSSNVKEVQLIFKDTSSVNSYIIDNIKTNTLSSSQTQTYQFKNNKVYSILDPAQITRLFDNVPLRAKSQELIGSRLIYGNYTQFFNLIDCDYTPIDPRFTLSITTEEVLDLNPKPTFKSNRDYEIGIVYLDDYGRSTTVIVPNGDNTADKTNTIFIPPSNATLSNNIRVTIDKDFRPPCFASNYRFVLKQNKQDYYNIFPLTYFTDGQFRWFLINQPDLSKISIGSYLYLKGERNLLPETQIKVLDIVSQSENFLNNSESQPAGVYFKVKINQNFLPDTFVFDGGSTTTEVYDAVENIFALAENPIFYGEGLNDLETSNGNIYSANAVGIPQFNMDARFYIEIDTVGTVDTFQYYVIQNGESKKKISVNPQVITAGADINIAYSGMLDTFPYTLQCTVKFNSSTGHKVGDFWVINCRDLNGSYSIFGGLTSLSGFGAFNAFPTSLGWNLNNTYVGDRIIDAGAIITIKSIYDGTITKSQTFISSKTYSNIEEWFIEDNAYLVFDGAINGSKDVCFRRVKDFPPNSGVNHSTDQGGSISEATLNYPIAMIIKDDRNLTRVQLDCVLNVFQQSVPVLFETVPTDTNQDVYYELSKTFPIINGAHAGNNQNQIIGTDPAIIDLNKSYPNYPNRDYNSFAWGNYVESYRVRDDFNGSTMEFSPRANSTVEGYEEQTLVQALSYSGVYTQTSAINRLNEFNLSLANFKYLDRFFGSIQKLYSRDTDLVVFQENKVSKVLYGKNLLSDSVGGGAIASVPEVLGTQISYEGEYGISLNPESFSRWGDNLYFTDARRGAVMALQSNGLFEISSQGMKNWFKANLDTNVVKLGMMDPYFEHYVLSIDNDRKVKTCSLSVTPSDLSFNGEAQSKTFYIQSNSDWEITVPTNTWVTLSDRFGSNNQLITVTVTENITTVRDLDITISSCADDVVLNISQTVLYDWYELLDCDTSDISYSIQYPAATYELNDRVTYGDATFNVVDVLHTQPLGTLINVSPTGLQGCPTPTVSWYQLVKCSDSSLANSQMYTAGTFNLDDRVTNGSDTYVIDGIIEYNPGGTLLPITSTGLTGCPSTVSDWYILYRCYDGASANSQSYAEGTFSINDRVTSAGITYIVDGIINYNPGGSLLSITATGLTDCPVFTTYYELSECSPGVGYAYTSIAPGGVGQRYVLPFPTTTFYTYTGASVSDTTPPSGYNGSIQITAFYSCP